MVIKDLIQVISISALPIIFAITLHEVAHGYVARYFGDPTAWVAGRLSLNPLRHVDPVGTLLVPLLILAVSYATLDKALLFGWARPVPVNFGCLRNPRRDMLWVAAAGPATNLLMTFFWTALLKLLLILPDGVYSLPLGGMAFVGISTNLTLMVLNLLPLPPLDGGRIVVSLLPYRLAVPFVRLERWGFPILLLLLFSGMLDKILWPLVAISRRLIFSLLQNGLI